MYWGVNMKQTVSDVVKEKCFNCHDKKEVIVENHETHHKLVKIPCPLCNGENSNVKNDR